jgi:hypothetical protein
MTTKEKDGQAMDEQQQQLMEVRKCIVSIINTLVDNASNLSQIHQELEEFMSHIQSYIILIMTAYTRTTLAIVKGLERSCKHLEILKEILDETPSKIYLGYYWLGMCIANLADLILQIDNILKRENE